MSLYAEVAVPLPVNQTFFYKIPLSKQEQAKIGVRVLVPFSGRILTGFIVKLRKKRVTKELQFKDIKEVLDQKPVFSHPFLSFTQKLSRYYFSSWGEILQASLPPSYAVRSRTVVFLSEDGEEALKKVVLSRKERIILSLLQKKPYTPFFLRKNSRLENVSSLLSRMEKKGFVYFQRELKKPGRRKSKPAPSPPRQLEIDFSWDSALRRIAGQISPRLDREGFSPFLLFGPRNKRESVYTYLIKHVLEKGKKVLFLVPEISQSRFLIDKFEKKLGRSVAIVHSRMTESRREKEWSRISEGKAEFVVGPRSALFSPLDNLGLIVVEEEHDDSYFQKESPSFDARKGAWLRAKEEKAVLVYGSDMPTVEAFYQAKKGGFLLSLEKEARRSNVLIVEKETKKGIISRAFREKIRQRLKNREQVMVFINRRGYAPLIMCSFCRYIPKCVRCDIALMYHKKEEKLVCRICNFSLPRIDACPECKGKIVRLGGFGIEAVEEELKKYFPRSRVASFALDEARTEKEKERIIQDFLRKKIDILVGTQLLAHSADLPSVSLVGIIHPETLLALSDFRASQKAFQTIGLFMRPLRMDGQSEVLIQTALPDHFAIRTGSSRDYISFFKREIRLRRLMNYPPFSHVIEVFLLGKNLRTLARQSRKFSELLNKEARDVEVLGPVLAPVSRLRGVYRVQITLKSRKRKSLEDVFRKSFQNLRLRKSISVLG